MFLLEYQIKQVDFADLVRCKFATYFLQFAFKQIKMLWSNFKVWFQDIHNELAKLFLCKTVLVF